MTQRPLDDIRALMADLPPPDLAARDRVNTTIGRRHPVERLGRLGEIIDWIVAWRGRPMLNRPIIALYAGSHAGRPDTEHTRSQMELIAAGGAPVSRAAGHLGAGLDVFDLAIDRPVGDPARGPTMSERECAATIAFGMEALAKTPDLLVLGALGEGAQDAARAIGAALDAPGEPLDMLGRLGGRETAAIIGAILAARTQRVPVLLEGYAAIAAAGILHAADPSIIAHCRVGSAPADIGARALLARLGLTPIVDLELTIEDGTGCAAALSVVMLACALGSGDGV